MTEQNVIIQCATCGISPVPVSPEGSEVWKCPQCGQQDAKDVILEQGKAHALEVAQRSLNDTVREIAEQSRFLTFKPGKVSSRSYRWITDFSLDS